MGKAETKSCIACAEDIKAEAMLCKHCNTRQDEPTFQKLAPKTPKQASANTKGSKAKSLGSSSNESTFPDVKPGVVFAVIAAVVVAIFIGIQANGFNLARTESPESNSGTSGTSSSSSSTNTSLKGEVGYYCEPNLCHLLITNVGSDPVSVSGDLCGILDGAVYIGDNYVSETLNPQITYEVDFSFLGPYQGDRLSKIWLGDCTDESSAELKWTNLSVATSSSSDSGSDGGSSGSSESSNQPTSNLTDQELLDIWLPSISVSGVSTERETDVSQTVKITFSFDPYPFQTGRTMKYGTTWIEGADGSTFGNYMNDFGWVETGATTHTVFYNSTETGLYNSVQQVAVHFSQYLGPIAHTVTYSK